MVFTIACVGSSRWGSQYSIFPSQGLSTEKKKRNFAAGWYDNAGVWREDEEDIEGIFSDYFCNMFTSTNPSDGSLQEVLKYINPIVSDVCNQNLLRPFTKDEIYAALQQMHPYKALGPDGMHAIFYQRFWHIVGDDVIAYVSSILHGSLPPSCINHTNIALIPQSEKAYCCC